MSLIVLTLPVALLARVLIIPEEKDLDDIKTVLMIAIPIVNMNHVQKKEIHIIIQKIQMTGEAVVIDEIDLMIDQSQDTNHQVMIDINIHIVQGLVPEKDQENMIKREKETETALHLSENQEKNDIINNITFLKNIMKYICSEFNKFLCKIMYSVFIFKKSFHLYKIDKNIIIADTKNLHSTRKLYYN